MIFVILGKVIADHAGRPLQYLLDCLRRESADLLPGQLGSRSCARYIEGDAAHGLFVPSHLLNDRGSGDKSVATDSPTELHERHILPDLVRNGGPIFVLHIPVNFRISPQIPP